MNRLKFFFLLLLLSVPLSLAAQESDHIKDIVIYGNTKTRDEVIRSIIRVNEGDTFSPALPYQIKRYLENQRKFSEVAVGYRKNEHDITLYIYVQDKWSLVAAPYYSYSDNDHSAGLIFLDSNFLGYQNILLLSLIYEYKTLNTKFLFSHPRVFGTPFSYVFLLYRDYQPVEIYEKDTIAESFFRDETGFMLNLKYQFFGEHYLMAKSFISSYEQTLSGKTEEKPNRYFQVFLELDWTHHIRFVGKGVLLGLYYEKDFLSSDVRRSIAGAKSEIYLNPWGYHNLFFELNYYRAFEISKYFTPSLGQDATFYSAALRGYERGQLRSDHAVSGTFEYRFPVMDVLSTTLVAAPFLDAALPTLDNGLSGPVHYTTGAALRFYFNEILIPAVQIYAGYGWKYDNLSLGFMIGTRL